MQVNRDVLLLAARHLDSTEGVTKLGRTMTLDDVGAIHVLLDLAAEYLTPRRGMHFGDS